MAMRGSGAVTVGVMNASAALTLSPKGGPPTWSPAHAITLTPGELVVEMSDEGTMYTHTLDTSHAEDHMAEAQKMREELLRKIML